MQSTVLPAGTMWGLTFFCSDKRLMRKPLSSR